MNEHISHTTLNELIAEGRRPLFVAGLVVGVGALLWLAFGATLLGGRAWWPFDPGALVRRLRFDAMRPHLSESQLTVWWVLAATGVVAGFGATWLVRRREHVLSHLEVLAQLRRVEHRAAVARADALWADFETAEYESDDARQPELLEQYAEAASHVDLTTDVRSNRVARCRALARSLTESEPQRALGLLQLATRLSRTGNGRAPALPRVLAADALAFLAGALATLLAIPAASLAVLLAIGFVVFVVKAVIAILQLIFAICVAIAIIGAIASK